MNPLRWIPALSAVAALCGCSTPPPCRLTVSNVSEVAVEQVAVQSGDRLLYSVPSIAPRTRAEYQAVREDLPRSFSVNWRPAGGAARSQTVEAPGAIPKSFRGRVYFEIAGPEVKLFVLPDSNDRGSDMPWARPESWEGFPSLPGFTPQ